MSLIKSENVQVGTSITDTQNFAIRAPGDGTFRVSRGNSGAEISDPLVINADDSLSANFASINGGQLAGLRNKIINGDMRIAQRGAVSIVNNSAQYGGADRHIVSMSATTVTAGSIVQTAAAPSFAASGFSFGASGVSTTGSTTGTLGQRIESANCKDLAGSPVTVSCKLFHDFGVSANWKISLLKASAENNFTSMSVVVAGPLVAVTSGAVTRLTFTTPSLTEADVQNGIMVAVGFDPTPALTNKGFFYSELQLEVGTVATPFEHRPFGMELSLCQRYFNSGLVANGTMYTTANAGLSFQVPPMRATPTLAVVGSSSLSISIVGVGIASLNPPSLSTTAGGANGLVVGPVTGATAAVGTPVNSTATISASAEL